MLFIYSWNKKRIFKWCLYLSSRYKLGYVDCKKYYCKTTLTLIPTNMIMPDGSRSPVGYLSWTKTWITHEYEKPESLWGINEKII